MTTSKHTTEPNAVASKTSDLNTPGPDRLRLSPVEQTLPDGGWQVQKMRQLRLAEKRGDARSANVLRTEILRAFDAYLRFMAKSYARRKRSAPGYRFHLEELYSTAKEALMIAIQRWDEIRGIPLSNLASRWIAGSCKTTNAESPHDSLKIPYRVTSAIREFKKIEASEGLQAAYCHLDEYRFRKSTSRSLRLLVDEVDSPSIKLDAPAAELGGSTLKDQLSDKAASPPPSQDLQALLREAMAMLEDRRAAFIFYMKHPLAVSRDSVGDIQDARGRCINVPHPQDIIDRVALATIAEYLQITSERVRQIEQDGRHQLYLILREKLSGHDLNALFSDAF